MHDVTAVEHTHFELVATEVHDVVEVDGHLAFLRDEQQPFGTIVAAGGGVEDVILVEANEHERFDAAGERERRDTAEHGALYEVSRDDHRFVHISNHLDGELVGYPLILVGVLEIDGRIVDGLRHVAEVDVEHARSSSLCWGDYSVEEEMREYGSPRREIEIDVVMSTGVSCGAGSCAA